jgi:hypothetical protein
MDEKIEKAFAVANYMQTLSNQRRIILEEFKQKSVYYQNGGTFTVTPSLITFTKLVLEMGHDENVPFIDDNDFPIVISNVQEFLDNLISVYFESVNEYSAKFAEIKSKRKVEDIVKL